MSWNYSKEAKGLLEDKQKLDALHEEFMAALSSPPSWPSEVGTMTLVAGELRANCLGFELLGSRRVVARERRFSANEYTFCTVTARGSEVVCRLYLVKHRGFYSSLEERGTLIALLRTGLQSELVGYLASCLPSSPAFRVGGELPGGQSSGES